MNTKTKMSDVFCGAQLINQDGFINDGQSDLGSLSCNSFTDAAVLAINSYDSNQETIQTLKCAIWEAITKLENSPRTCQSSAVVILQRALKDTEDLS